MINFLQNGIEVHKSSLNIKRTLECGQVFRYFKEYNDCYTLISGDKLCRLYYSGNSTVIQTDFPQYFANYFDLYTDYDDIINRLSGFSELKEALLCAGGLRILRQQPFETVVSFIISANNNIKRIKGIIERLCKLCGKNINGVSAFPTREALSKLTVADYRALGCGFRDRYLYNTVPMLTDEFLGKIATTERSLAKKELCSLNGVGPKVADCILLFAYGFTDSYPVDTWIFKACKTEELNTPIKVEKYYGERYGKLSGYAQQYVFEYMRTGQQGAE